MNNQLTLGPAARWLAVLVILAVALLTPQRAGAQAPQGHVAYVYPAGGQQGETVELTVGGSDLAGAKGIRVSGEGVTGRVLEVEKGEKAKIVVSIAPNAEPGQRDLRLITPGGMPARSASSTKAMS